MRKLLLIAGLACLTQPNIASAQPSCPEQQRDSRAAGTVAGAGLSAVIGSPSADCGSRTLAGRDDDRGISRSATGYYDSYGNWVAGARPKVAPSADTFSADVAYVGGPGDLFGREDQLQRRIEVGEDRGAISRYDADGDRSRLSSIRDLQGRLRDDQDGLSGDDRADLNSRLDDLDASLNAQWRE